MKKAFSSVFKAKHNNDVQKNKLEISEDSECNNIEKDFGAETEQNFHLSEDKMKSYNSTGIPSLLNDHPTDLLSRQTSSSSSLSTKSHVLHHFRTNDITQSSLYDRQSSERKLSLEQFDSRLQNAAKDVCENLSAVCTTPDYDDSDDETFQKYEHHRNTGASKTQILGDGYKAEKAMAINDELKRIQNGDSKFEERSSARVMKAKMEGNGFTASKAAAFKQDQKQVQIGDSLMQQQSSAKASAMKFQTDDSLAENKRFESQEEKRSVSQGKIHQETNMTSQSSSCFISSSKSSSLNNFQMATRSNSQSPMNSPLIEEPFSPFSPFSPTLLSLTHEVDLEFGQLLGLTAPNNNYPMLKDVESVNKMTGSMAKIEEKMFDLVEKLKDADESESLNILTVMNNMIRKAWSVPSCGDDIGFNLSSILRKGGALEILVKNCQDGTDPDIQLLSAQILEQCLTSENRAYVVENGLSVVVNFACKCIYENDTIKSQTGTGLLEHLFKHSEETCKKMIGMGGLKAIVYECRSTDIETLRHCAFALANLSLYGGSENQVAMIKQKAPDWLFPLAFHYDDNIKYYACLAIAVLVANKEVEAAVLRSGTLNLVEPFVSSHNPEEFATSFTSHIHGQSKNWLLRLVPVLDSKREEARSLAAFHFAMEAWIKKTQGNTSVFREIGAIEPLKKVASCPNAIASKYAAQTLRLIGEEVPHKLSQQVPLWTIEDVIEWVTQIGFSQYTDEFINSRVDGDLLLQLNEDMLQNDIGIMNGILRKRFLRELGILKRIADYSSCDSTNLNGVLNNLGPEFSRYTYSMLQSGVDKDTLRLLDEETLKEECKIENSIHRTKILQTIKDKNTAASNLEEKIDDQKTLDVFVSYRRSNGSQLASLLKVHLQLRGFSVFIDVERLEAGKFDNNLLNSIKQAKHFILVLTPNALDRCIGDKECKDWIHREIVEALQSKCNIIPIIDTFQWPDTESLPEDMKAVCYFNGVRWIHDYQDACVDKLERFMRGEFNAKNEIGGPFLSKSHMAIPGTPGTPSIKPPMCQRSGSNDSGKSNENNTNS